MKRIFKKLLLIVAIILIVFLVGCGSGPYVGKYIMYNWPITYYNGGHEYDQLSFLSDDGSEVLFQYTIDNPKENTYIVKGTMTHSIRVSTYRDVYIHLWLADGRCIVEDIRLFSRENDGENTISFIREFVTDKKFDAISFGYRFIYTY